MTLGWLWWPAWLQVDAAVVAAHLAISTFTLHGRRGDWRHGRALCMALGDIDRHFVWQAWHWATWTCPLRGRRGTYWHWVASGGALGSRLAPWSPRLFAWQAWRLATSTFTLRGKRGTWRHGSSLCVAGVADSGGAWAPFGAVVAAAACVAGVALGDIDRHFAWQAWHLWHWTGSGGALGSRLAPWAPRLFAWQAWHLATSTFTLRGRRGTWRHGSSLCVAGVALTVWHWTGSGGALGSRLAPWSPQLFAWQAWRLVTSRQQVNPSL